MKLTFKLENTRRLKKRLAAIGERAKIHVSEAIDKELLVTKSEAVRAIQRGTRSGRVYKRGKGRVHQASAPGEFPKTDRGRLVSSLFVERKKSGLAGIMGSGVVYGKYLEYGTSRTRPRPWLRRTFRKRRPMMERRVRVAMLRSILEAKNVR